MKTAASAFEGYVHDRSRPCRKPAIASSVPTFALAGRIFALAPVRFPSQVIRQSLLTTFASHESKSYSILVRNGGMRPGSGAANLRDYPHMPINTACW